MTVRSRLFGIETLVLDPYRLADRGARPERRGADRRGDRDLADRDTREPRAHSEHELGARELPPPADSQLPR